MVTNTGEAHTEKTLSPSRLSVERDVCPEASSECQPCPISGRMETEVSPVMLNLGSKVQLL